jgi:hypothetical protein
MVMTNEHRDVGRMRDRAKFVDELRRRLKKLNVEKSRRRSQIGAVACETGQRNFC